MASGAPDHRHHLLRAARALGGVGPARRARAALLRRVGRAGRRPCAARAAERGRRSTRRSTSSTASSSRAGSTSTRRSTAPSATRRPTRRRCTATPASCACSRRRSTRDLPTLAICRGFQLLNVLRGGDLIQHLPEEVGHEGHRETLGVFSQHPVDDHGGDEARGDPRPAPRRRELEPPPGRRSRGGGARRERLRRGRVARGDRGSLEDVRARRALAPRDGGRRQAPLRGARRRSARSSAPRAERLYLDAEVETIDLESRLLVGRAPLATSRRGCESLDRRIARPLEGV